MELFKIMAITTKPKIEEFTHSPLFLSFIEAQKTVFSLYGNPGATSKVQEVWILKAMPNAIQLYQINPTLLTWVVTTRYTAADLGAAQDKKTVA